MNNNQQNQGQDFQKSPQQPVRSPEKFQSEKLQGAADKRNAKPEDNTQFTGSRDRAFRPDERKATAKDAKSVGRRNLEIDDESSRDETDTGNTMN